MTGAFGAPPLGIASAIRGCQKGGRHANRPLCPRGSFLGGVVLDHFCLRGGKKLPPDIQADIKKRFPGSKVLSFTEEPKKHIEVAIELKGGTKVEVIYASKVVVKHVFAAEEVGVSDLPIAVVNGVEKKFPGSTIKKAEKVLNAKGKIVLYQVLLTKKGGGTVEAHVTPAGMCVNEFSIIGQGPLTPDRRDLALALAGRR